MFQNDAQNTSDTVTGDGLILLCWTYTVPISGVKEGNVSPVKFLEASIFGQRSIHRKLQMGAVYIHVM